jgi:cytochrome c peroxidase
MKLRNVVVLALIANATLSAYAQGQALTPIEQLGKRIFFDRRLSDPPGQACVTCHLPAAGWTGDTSQINENAAVYPGALHQRSGNRKPPSAAYATFSPVLHYDAEEQLFVGGNFWDGRATGWLLGDPAAEQAQGPFLNPVEQNIQSPQLVVESVCRSDYGTLLREIYGEDICDNTINAYNAIGKAISAFEASREVNAFSSKYDYYLRDPKRYPLTEDELLGLQLFENEKKGNCAACHPSRPGADGAPPLFTDFTFDNLGFPKNPRNTWYQMPKQINPDGEGWIDEGLGGFLSKVPRFAKFAEANRGKHKVPTLRNVDLRPAAGFVKSFGHNGYFKSLKDLVHFYNARDLLPVCGTIQQPEPNRNCWPAAEVTANVNQEELGNLGLTEQEEWALVSFMKTLSDGWTPPRSE